MCSLMLARASDLPYGFDLAPQKFLSTGMTGGRKLGSSVNGGFLGFETSYTIATKGVWYGASGAIVNDFDQIHPHLFIGPNIGKLVFGIDGGLGLRFRESSEVELGFHARPMLNFGVVVLYYRYTNWPSAKTSSESHQIGLTVKVPNALSYSPRPFDLSQSEF